VRVLYVWVAVSVVVLAIIAATVYLSVRERQVTSQAATTYVETFDTTAARDATTSTVDWNTSLGLAQLPHGNWYQANQTTVGEDQISYPTTSARTNTQGRFAMATDPTGAPVVCYADDAGFAEAFWDIYVARWNGTAWAGMSGSGNPDNVSNTAETSNTCMIAFDNSGTAHVVYAEDNPSDIYHSSWTGAAWTAPDLVYSSVVAENSPTIAFDSSDNPIVAFHSGTAPDLDILVAFYNGATWDAPTNLTSSPGTQDAAPSIASDSSGNPAVAYFSQGSGTVYTSFDGLTWSAPEVVSTSGGNSQGAPVMLFDTEDRAVLAFSSNTSILLTRRVGGAWQKLNGTLGIDTVVTLASAGFASLALDTDNNPHVAFIGSCDTGGDVCYTGYDGTQWVGADGVDDDANVATTDYDSVTLSLTTADAQFPHLSLDAEQEPMLAYTNSPDTVDYWRFTHWADNYESPAVAQSLEVDSVTNNISSATLTVEATVPAGTSVAYEMTNNGANNWEPVTVGATHVFSTKGADLRWRATVTGNVGDLTVSPQISTLTIAYDSPESNVVIDKGVDTNADGLYIDDGVTVTTGQVLEYKLDSVNIGTGNASTSTIADFVPTGSSFVDGSVTIDGEASSATSADLAAGIDTGVIPGRDIFQSSWLGGPGQTGAVSDYTKYATSEDIQYAVSEVITKPTGAVHFEPRFSPVSSRNYSIDDGTDFTYGTSGAILNSGSVAFAWVDSAVPGIMTSLVSRDHVELATSQVSTSDPSSPPQFPAPSSAFVEAMPDGGYIVVWTEIGQASFGTCGFGDDSWVYMRRYDANGTALGAPVTLDSITTGDGSCLSINETGVYGVDPVAVDGSGNIFATYQYMDTSFCNQVAYRGFDANGTPLSGFGSRVLVSDPLECTVTGSSIARNSAGNLGLVWADGAGEVDSRIMSAAGTAVAAQLQVSDGTAVSAEPSIAAMPNNDFVVVYNYDLGAATGDTFARFIDDAGAVAGAAVELDTTSLSNNFGTAVGVDQSNGNIFVGWMEWNPVMLGHSGGRLYTTLLDDALTPIASGFDVMPDADDDDIARRPGMVIDSTNHRALLVWTAGASTSDPYAALLQLPPAPTATLESSIFDATGKTDWGLLEYTAATPAGTGVTVEVRTGNSPTPNPSWSSYTAITNGADVPFSSRYLQYRVTLTSSDVDVTPSFHDISIASQGRKTLTFQVRVTATGPFVITNQGSVEASANPAALVPSNSVSNPVGPKGTDRIAGDTRIGTAVEVSKRSFPNAGSASNVILVRSDDPVDALPAAPLADALNAPILLTPPSGLDPAVATELQRVLAQGGTVYLMGGTVALNEQVELDLTSNGFTSQVRVGGARRQETAVLIAEKIEQVQGQPAVTAFLANGYTAVDALVAGAAAVRPNGFGQRAVILLASVDDLPAAAADYISGSSLSSLHVLGGTAVISEAVHNQATQLKSGLGSQRLGGSNRFATAALIANAFFQNPTQVFITSGVEFPGRTPAGVLTSGVPVDALVVSPFAGTSDAPILLVKPTELMGSTETYLKNQKTTISLVTAIGGVNAVAQSVLDAALAAIQ